MIIKMWNIALCILLGLVFTSFSVVYCDVSLNNTESIISASQTEKNISRITKNSSPVINSTVYTIITSPEFPDPFPNGYFEWTVTTVDGHGVEIIVKSLDIGISTLLIRPGNKTDIDEDSIIFTYSLKSERKYRFDHKDDLYMFFDAVNEKGLKGFEIHVKSIARKEETTLPPPTEIPPNTIYPYENSEIYLYGRNHNDFLANVSESFKQDLANIATHFCEDRNITIEENITVVENVFYHLIGPCNINWVNSELCTFINYSISVSYDNDTNTYELSRNHLDEMWKEYSKDVNLTKYNMSIYETPNDAYIIFLWILIFSLICVCFAGSLYFVWKYSDILTERFDSVFVDNDDKKVIVDDDLLGPMPYQDIPPLFGMDSYAPDYNAVDSYRYSDDKYPGNVNMGYEIDVFDMSDEIMMSLPDLPEETSGYQPRQYDNKTDDKNKESNL